MLEEVKVKTKLHETKPVSLTKVLGSPLHPPHPSFQMRVSRGYTNTRLFFEGGKGGTRPLTET